MNHWIFQGNPDRFKVDQYLAENDHITWSINQKHYADQMEPGDEVFIWRAAGKSKQIAGIVARGVLTAPPTVMEEDEAGKKLWVEPPPSDPALLVQIKIRDKCLGPKEMVKRDWLKDDPVVSGLRILKMAIETNYLIGGNEAERLAALVRNTGRDWNHEESIAGLWAYARTQGRAVSRMAGSPVAEVALAIGRAVSGVYNKVMNFRALDPTDTRSGLSSGGQVDREVWTEFFDVEQGRLRLSDLEAEYARLWGRPAAAAGTLISKPTYKDFGDAPNDDPAELRQFSLRVRRGQAAFRSNLLAAFGERCCILGHGPKEVLEAVHIIDHAKSGINELDNGLLMRADLHTLFDDGLLKIDPESLKVVIDSRLESTPYWKLNGRAIRPRVGGSQVGKKYLKARWEQSISFENKEN